jgi:four helix bundle protein
MQDFQRLKVWEKSHILTLAIYKATESFPTDERFGLTRQIRRAASSIPANIAEGCGRNSPREFKHFLTIAAGSASELEYHLLLARDLGFGGNEVGTQVSEIKRMLWSLMQKLNTDN